MWIIQTTELNDSVCENSDERYYRTTNSFLKCWTFFFRKRESDVIDRTVNYRLNVTLNVRVANELHEKYFGNSIESSYNFYNIIPTMYIEGST